MSGRSHGSGQLGFEALLSAAEEDNRRRRFERETAHLPGRMDEALPFYRELIRRHDKAMVAGAVDEAMALREEAHKLALRLNDGEPGILAGPDAPGSVLARETAASSGTVPLWGQEGAFVIAAGSMQVRIEIDGMFGIGCSSGFWPGFSAHAVEADRPFLSETGYRSFLGIYAEPVPGLTPDSFAQKVIEDYVARSLKGRLVAIGEEYRSRFAGGGGS